MEQKRLDNLAYFDKMYQIYIFYLAFFATPFATRFLYTLKVAQSTKSEPKNATWELKNQALSNAIEVIKSNSQNRK